MPKPDRLADLLRAPSIEDLVRFKREADFHEKTSYLIERLVRFTRSEERGECPYQRFDHAYQSLISHLGMIAGVEELGGYNIRQNPLE